MLENKEIINIIIFITSNIQWHMRPVRINLHRLHQYKKQILRDKLHLFHFFIIIAKPRI